MAKQAYFNGNFYQCATATNAGETPLTHPAKWRLVRIPKEWRRVLARLTYANLLEIDGQKDKAKAEIQDAQVELEELVRKEANRQHRRERPAVKGYC